MKALDVINNSLGEDCYDLGFLIKSMRIFSEIKGVELAKKLGISKQQLSLIESNKLSVSPRRAKDIADAIGVCSDSFVKCATIAYLKRQGFEVECVEIKFKKEQKNKEEEESLEAKRFKLYFQRLSPILKQIYEIEKNK